MIEFELIDDTQELNVELEDNTQNVEFNLTDYDDSEIKEEISNVDNRVDELGYYVDTQIDGLNDEINGLSNQVGTNTIQIAQNKADITTLSGRVDQIPIITKTSQITNDSGFITSDYHDSTKQDTLISGTNIKTINGISVLGDGNITIESGAGDYSDLTGKPKINNIELNGNKSLNDLGVQPAGDYALSSDIPTKTSDLTNDSGFIANEIDPTVPNHVKNITQNDITSWNNKSTFSGNYNDLTNKPTIPDELSDLSDDSTHRLVTDTEKTTWNNKADAGFTGIITGTSSNPTDAASLPVGVYKASDNQNISYINLLMEDGTTKRQSVQKGGIVIRTAARLEIFATQNLMYQYDTTNDYFYPAESFIESNLRRDYEAEGGYASLGTVSPPNNIFITSPINTLEATINTGEIGHSRIIFSVEDGIAKGDFGLSLTDADGNDLIYNNGALPKPVAGESWIFDFVGNRCNATLYKSTYLDRDRDEQILFLVRSNSNQIYYPNLDSKPSITVQSAKGSTDPGRPVVMEYSEPFLTSFQNVEYYGIPQFIPLDLSIYNTSTQANQLHPYTQLPDGDYWVKYPGRMWLGDQGYALVGKEIIHKKGTVLCIMGGEYACAYYDYDTTEGKYLGGYFTTEADVQGMIDDGNFETGLTIVRQTTVSGTTTVNNGKWNKRTNPVNSMTLATANLTEIPDTFKARVTVQTSATFTTFNISQRTAFKVYFAGWDCTNGVLAGKPNAFYNIDYRADGRGNIIAMVTGYDVPTT